MSSLSHLLASIIQYFYTLTVQLGIPSYGLAIIIFTIMIKVVLFPLTQKQMRALKKMQEIQPKIQDVQKKHKGNPQKSQQAVMELYKEHGANPFGGCWPLLIQMPILFALFSTLKTFFVNKENVGFLWITNLGATNASVPDASKYILPVLVAVSMFAQQYIQQKSTMAKVTDPSQSTMQQTQKTMLYMMPLMLGYFSLNFPAGLSLYWVVYNIMATLEQFVINRKPSRMKEEISSS
ncbi:MAG: YidC/Oxa1 family membrane protein insertase [Bacillota bacterium]